MAAEEKQMQRRRGISARRGLAAEARTAANGQICRQLSQMERIQGAGIILAYAAFGGEVDLTQWITWAAQQGKTVAYPVCLEGCTMVAAVPQGEAGWETGRYGIRTPVLDRSRLVQPEKLDVVLVPCTAFDEDCWRVGMGKGYYDRYLPRCTKAERVGVAFEAQKVPHAATDCYDQRLDAYVTERKIYTWKK